jgi:galactose mutarotase-like enzyme
MLTVLALACFLILLAIGCRTRHHQFYQAVESPRLLIGGREPVVLTRPQSDGGLLPELISATLLPGRGMNLLQLTAYLPGTGMVPIFASPEPDQVNTLLSAPDADRNGAGSAAFGGSLLLPFDGPITGTLSADGQSITIPWHGKTLTLPTDAAGRPISSNGLFNNMAPTSLEVDALPDGEMSTAVFEPGDFKGRWPSTTRITVVTTLTRKAVDITITAQNTGSEPEPMNIGWRPFFAIPSGQRSQVQLILPSSERAATDSGGNFTGQSLPVANTPYDFSPPNGAALGSSALDATYLHLHSNLIQDAPVAELIDRLGTYGLRITLLSPTIKALHVVAPAGKPVVSIAPRMSLDNNLAKAEGITTLQPGDSIEWKLRLEIFRPSHTSDSVSIH